MGDKNNIAEVECTDTLVKSGHGIIKAIYAQPGDRVWVVRDGDSVAAATGTVTLACATALVAACGTITVACPVANTFACGTITLACALVEATATGTVTQICAVGEVHALGAITIACVTLDATACGTVTLATALAADTVTINGLVYTAVAGIKCGNTEFSIDGTDTADAADLACSVANDTRCGTCTCGVTVSSCLAVVTVTTVLSDADANCVGFVSSNACRLAVSACGFTCGKDTDTVTVNGLLYTAVCGAKACDTQFNGIGSNCAVATDLADSIDDDVRAGCVDDLTAVSAAAVVTATSTVGGTGGNAITISDTAGCRITSGATFTCGVNGDFVTLNGLVYTATVGSRADDTEFSIDTSNCAAAIDLTAAINGDGRTGCLQDLTSTSCTTVSTLIPTCSGAAANAITLATNCAGNLAISSCVLTGGVTADTVTVNGLLYTASCATCACAGTFDVCGETNCVAATNLASAITNDCRSGTSGDQTGCAASAVVTVTTDVCGIAGNCITLATTDTCTLAITAFTGGVDADTVTVNGLIYTAICGVKSCDTEFNICGSNCTIATDLADSIDDDVRCGCVDDLTSTAAAAVVTSVVTVAGSTGNAVTQTTTGGARLVVTTPFAGGTDADILTVNGLAYTGVTGARCGDTEFSVDCSDCAAATDLAAAITADCRVGITVPLLDQTGASVCAVVTITAEAGDDGSLIDLSSNDAGTLAVSGAFLSGGAGSKVMTVTGNANNHFSAPYINHPVKVGIFVDAISGTSGTISIVYE